MKKSCLVLLAALTILVLPLVSASAIPSNTASAAQLNQGTQFQGTLVFPVFNGDPDQMQYDIVSLDLAKKDRQLLLQNASQPAISHDGKAIAYKSWIPDQKRYGLHAAQLKDIPGTDWRFSDAISAQRPQWAPNDSFFAFHSRQESDRLDRVMITQGPQAVAILRPDLDNKEVLGKSPAVVVDGGGFAVVYQGCEYSKCGLWRRSVNGANPVQITEEPSDQALSSSPDGKWLAFMSYERDKAKDWEIYVMAADGTKVKRLTNHPGIDGLPTWSSDGNWVAFVRETSPGSNQWDVMAIRPDGTDEQKLAEIGALNGQVKGTTPDQGMGWMEEQISWVGGGQTVAAPSPESSPVSTKAPAKPITPAAPKSTPAKAGLSGLSGSISFPVFDGEAGRSSFDVMLVDLQTMKQAKVLSDASQPSLSSDGTWIAYKNWGQAQNLQGLHAAALADIAGTDWQFTPAQEAQRPSWVPGDLFFSFYSRQESDRTNRVMITKGSQPVTIPRPDFDNKEIMGKTPLVLMDKAKGDYIMYQGCESTQCGVWKRTLSGENPVQITQDTSDQSFSQSPDGQWVAYMSYERDGAKDWEIYTMAPDGSKVKRLTQHPGNDGLPTWSPDGKWIAFVRETTPKSNVWDLMAIRPDGSEEKKLFTLGALDGRAKGATADQGGGWLEEQIAWGPKVAQ